jgi:hypothetical protein
MATPCCPKCGKTSFHKTRSAALYAFLIYCAHCGAVVGVVPARGAAGTTTSGKGGVTAGDDWEARV